MTKPAQRRFGNPHHLIPLAELPAAIERHLKAAPRKRAELVKLVGYSESEVRRQLLQLEQESRVHRVQHRSPQYQSRYWLWHAGAGDIPAPIERKRKKECNRVRQVITSDYPNIGRRDPLVAALFGNVCKEAA